MSVQAQESVTFDGTPTTSAERELLQQAGFVHVTGLKAVYPDGRNSYIVGEQLKATELGSWGMNNGICSIVTLGGEVWIRGELGKDPLHQFLSPVVAVREFAPNGRKAFVPFSNGEGVELKSILRRVADPGYGLQLRN